jgi:hypothetical protein
MPVRERILGWTQQPQEAAAVNRDYGSQLDVWVPQGNTVLSLSGQPTVGINYSYAALASSRFGREVRKTGSDFFNGLTIPARAGAGYQCWMVVLGSTVTSTTGTNPCLLDASGNGLQADANGVTVRAASTNHIVTSVVPSAGEAVFAVLRNGDYRVYQRGVKYSSSAAFGSPIVNAAIGRTNHSLVLLARWTDETPTDDAIWRLLGAPWEIIAPQRVWVPVNIGGSTVSGADPGSYAITGAAATALRQHVSVADSGAYSIAGLAATGAKSAISAADSGSFTITGSSATDLLGRVSSANSGAYAITGFDATGILPQISDASPGAYVLTGFDATASTSRVSAANAGSFAITGFAATALYTAWPDPADVRAGVMYGPTGTEYTGTLVAGVAAGSFLDVSTGRRVLVANGVAVTL